MKKQDYKFVVLDNSAWGRIAEGKWDVDRYRNQGFRLLVHPNAISECIKGFAQGGDTAWHCKQAIKAMRHYGSPRILNNSVHHLLIMFGINDPYPPGRPQKAWCDLMEITSKSSTLDEIREIWKKMPWAHSRKFGIESLDRIFEVSVNFDNYSIKFNQNTIKYIEPYLPGYRERIKTGKIPSLQGSNKQQARKELGSDAFIRDVIRMLCERCGLAMNQEYMERGCRAFMAYGRIYGAYLYDLMCCGHPPKEGDFFDMDNFLYVQEGRIVLFHEPKWIRLAKKAQMDHILAPRPS